MFRYALATVVLFLGVTARGATDLKYAFGKAADGFTRVSPDDQYTLQRGYGFDLGSKWTAGNSPFFFSARLEPGEYRATVTLGDPSAETIATVKSESRRLMLENVHVPAGQTQAFPFLVHIRVPQIPTGGQVSLKARERDPILFVQAADQSLLPFKELDWDEKLTLEFTGKHPTVDSIEIKEAESVTTVYLVGDSTMTDQMMEPWAGWGQMLPRFFAEPVVVANYAESGETTASFIGEHRWAKLLSEIHPGDYVLIQFGINDQRMPVDRFKQYFIQFIKDAKDHGATPVLVTSQNLKRLDANGKAVQTLGTFPDAMRAAAKEQGVMLIDLNAMSMTLYEAIGPEKIGKMFVDGTHQNDYGAYELAKCVVNAVASSDLPIAKNVVSDFKGFDPAHPDAMETFDLPADLQIDPARPGGPGAPNGQGPMAAPRAGGASRPASTRGSR